MADLEGAGAPEGQRRPGQLLTQLGPCSCRWPVVDGPEGEERLTLFCGEPIIARADGRPSPYCPDHHQLAYEPCGCPDTWFDPSTGRTPHMELAEPLALEDVHDVLTYPQEHE